MKKTKNITYLNPPIALDHLGLIRISGQDAESFLQGQLTCDIKALTEELSFPAAYCSPKGRAIASFQVIKESNKAYLLILSKDLTEKVSTRLKMFVMRSKVEIDDLTSGYFIAGLTIEPDTQLADGLNFPTKANNVVLDDSEIRLKLPGSPTRFIIIQKEKKSLDSKEQSESSLSKWLLNDINNGLPLITAAVSEEYIPQMLNLDLLGGISFKKGCYTGQEIIARMHYLGKLKQRTFLASIVSEAAPEVRSPIFHDGQKIGSILMVERDTNDKAKLKLLVVMQISHANNEIKLKNNHSSALTFEDLPYTFENE
jgi:folate-binding protein YgfZ